LNISNRNAAPRYKRDGITSYLLASKRTGGAENIAVTLVEMDADGFQHIHKHEPEQTYTILEGSGLMTVDGEQQQVGPGDCIFIPSSAEHGLQNTGGTMLKYLSAASPSFTLQECLDWWPLPSLDEESTQKTS
jgi:mannose-6-phosphate isomerase-like protein (cupin superfamily)